MFLDFLEGIGRKYQALRLRHIRGVFLGGKVWVWGRPVVTVVPEARISLDAGVRLRSKPDGYHGPMFGPVRLSAVKAGAEISVGKETRLFGCTIHAWSRVTVGSYCLLAANVAIMDAHGHSSDDTDCFQRIKVHDEPAGVTIGNYVWIGLGSIITKGVTIGDGSIIGAGSVVTRDIPPFSVAAGSPARVLRRICPPEFLKTI